MYAVKRNIKRTISFIIRALVIAAALVFLALFLMPMTSNMINYGNIAGALLCAWAICVAFKPLHRGIKRLTNRFALTRFLRRFVNACFIVFAVYGAVVTTAMVIAAVQPPAEGATAVVLGTQVNPSGKPSAMLRRRIDAAEDFLEKNPEAPMILSGGMGSGELISEAECMYDAITLEKGDGYRLYKEDRSSDTVENLTFSKEIIDENGLDPRLAVVSDGFHQLRARIIAHQLGIDEGMGAVSANTSWLYLPTFAVREWIAIPYQLFVDPAA